MMHMAFETKRFVEFCFEKISVGAVEILACVRASSFPPLSSASKKQLVPCLAFMPAAVALIAFAAGRGPNEESSAVRELEDGVVRFPRTFHF
jgi:hypothetical protein